MTGYQASARGRFIAAFMNGRLVVVMLALGILASGCSDSTAGAGSAATNTPAATRTIATATPATGIQDATLGGTQVAFAAIYSAAGDSVPGHYKGDINGTPVFIVALFLPNGHAHHLRLIPQDSGVKWSASTGSQIATAFLPKDAKHLQDVTVSGSGLEHLYLSATLASTFTADEFLNADTFAPVTPGTLYFVCGGDLDVDSGGCEFELGR
jgi:hypothetical protein